MKAHTDKEYEQELQRVRDMLASMGGIVENMLRDALSALQARDRLMAEHVIAKDKEVNALEKQVDQSCIRILALRQPAASDLRFLATALKVVTDIERMGDIAVNVAERVAELCNMPAFRPYVDLPLMGRIAREMFSEAMDALARTDIELAQSVIARDNVLDAFYAQMLRELLTYMMEDPRNIPGCFKLLAIAKNLERLGDHVTNIAEQVMYLAQGQDIRHEGLGKPMMPEGAHLVRPNKGVLFVSLANSARSQMAEAWGRHLAPHSVEVGSAGLAPSKVHPMAAQVMAEIGLDISGWGSKTIDQVPIERYDVVVTLCDEGKTLKLPEGVTHIHWPIADPVPAASLPDGISVFRKVRDDLAARVERLFREE